MKRSDGPFVVRMARDTGTREPRYAHLFGDQEAEQSPVIPATEAPPSGHRLDQLEVLVLELQENLDDIKRRLVRLEGETGR